MTSFLLLYGFNISFGGEIRRVKEPYDHSSTSHIVTNYIDINGVNAIKLVFGEVSASAARIVQDWIEGS